MLRPTLIILCLFFFFLHQVREVIKWESWQKFLPRLSLLRHKGNSLHSSSVWLQGRKPSPWTRCHRFFHSPVSAVCTLNGMKSLHLITRWMEMKKIAPNNETSAEVTCRGHMARREEENRFTWFACTLAVLRSVGEWGNFVLKAISLNRVTLWPVEGHLFHRPVQCNTNVYTIVNSAFHLILFLFPPLFCLFSFSRVDKEEGAHVWCTRQFITLQHETTCLAQWLMCMNYSSRQENKNF